MKMIKKTWNCTRSLNHLNAKTFSKQAKEEKMDIFKSIKTTKHFLYTHLHTQSINRDKRQTGEL